MCGESFYRTKIITWVSIGTQIQKSGRAFCEERASSESEREKEKEGHMWVLADRNTRIHK